MPDSSLSEPDLYALQKKISTMRDSKYRGVASLSAMSHVRTDPLRTVPGGIEAQRPDLRLSDLSNLLGYDWIVLAPHLDIEDSDINIIKTEYPANVGQQARAMLRLWLSNEGNKASGK